MRFQYFQLAAVAAAGFLNSLFFGAAYGADLPLTLAAAQRRAVEQSQQIAAQDAGVIAAREMAHAAAQLPDPLLKFGIDNLPINGADQFSVARDFMTQRYVGLSQQLTRSDKRQLRAQRWHNEADTSEAEKAATVAAIQRGCALVWFERYYAEALEAVIAQQIAEAKLEIVAADGAYRAGRGSQADLIAAHGALAAIEDQAREMAARTRSAKTALARWIGAAADAPLADKPEIEVIRLDPDLLGAQLSHHPEITVLARQQDLASTEAQLARADKQADWSLDLSFAQRGSAYSNMVSIGVSIPLQWDQKNRQSRELAAKLALVEQARARYEDALRAHLNEVRVMIGDWGSRRERLARYRRESVPLAGERTMATLSAYRGGKASLTDLLLARRNELDVRMKAIALEAEIARLWAQLEFLVPDHTLEPPASAATRAEKPK